jgi:DNA repair protein SbcC/Rad50
MRSLELELEGFTSFRSRQTLDFSDLDLFAITGPTGAGKTSLLERRKPNSMKLQLMGKK